MNDSRKARSIKEDFIVYSNEDKIQTDFNCPHCNQGYLYIDNNLSIYRVNKEYENNLEHFIESPPYIYDYTSQITGFLKCNDCEQEVSFIGEIKGGIITYNHYEYGEMDSEEELLYFKYFYPPINLIELKNEYPNTIKDILKESFSLFYNHKEACINELKKVWKLLVNNLCDKVKIEQENDLKTKMEKLVLKYRYSRIKKDLMLLQYLYNPDFNIFPCTIYPRLENILTFIYKDKYPYISPLIITEGKTDWKHLKKALERFQSDEFNLYKNLNIKFEEYQDIGAGESTIDNWLKSTAKLKQERIHIFMFDRDTHNYVKEYGKRDFIRVLDKDYLNRLKEKLEKHYADKSSVKYKDIVNYLDDGLYEQVDEDIKNILTGEEYKEWNKLSHNQVYALCIPEIKDSDSPRTLDKICIEFYYKEKDLKTTKDGKRLFFADEFEFNKNNNGDNSKRFISKCGKFKTISAKAKNGARTELTLVSTPIYSIDDEQCKNNLLLSKNDFTKYIENDIEGFDNFDIENFKLIFDVIEKIVND